MSAARLPQLAGSIFLTDGGLETDLIYRRGVDLPEFAAFVLHEDAEGYALLREYFADYVRIASEAGFGLVLETATYRASADWGDKLGYDAARLRTMNERSVALLRGLASEADGPVVISGAVGPRGDAYAGSGPANADEAFAYHRPQVAVLAASGAELVSAFTLTDVAEAIGFVRAAEATSIPAVVSFTLETDGQLPSGMSLVDAIAAVDRETDGAAAYFMINCAHPDHFMSAFAGAEPGLHRVRGVRANASRLSHAALDESVELDDGDPEEFGGQMVAVHADRSHVNVLGGCCGTDARHIAAIARACEL